jgi:hypothetical protein
LRALEGIGPAAGWAVATLRHAAALHGEARSTALKELGVALRRSLGQGAPSIDPAHLAKLAAANRAMYTGLFERIGRSVATFITTVLQAVLGWLAQDHHFVYVAGVLCLAALAWVALKFGGLLPRGAANALYGDAAAAQGPLGLWRQAQERWNRGDHLDALAYGRRAVIARLDQGGLVRAVPGISDREIERKLARSPLGETARRFRRAHAYGRWAEGRDDAVQEAWEQLDRLWRGGDGR